MSDPDAKYKAEFKAEPRYAKSMSEADFVSMRRIDEGLDFWRSQVFQSCHERRGN